MPPVRAAVEPATGLDISSREMVAKLTPTTPNPADELKGSLEGRFSSTNNGEKANRVRSNCHPARHLQELIWHAEARSGLPAGAAHR